VAIMGWDAPSAEYYDEGENFAHEHTDGMAGIRDMGHGNTCSHCNDARLHGIKKDIGRIGSFKMGMVEHKIRKLHGRA
jgi:hypothetical protein